MTDQYTPPPMTLELWVRDTGERVVSTFLQYALLWLLAMPATGNGVARSLVAACLPPVLVVITSALPGLTYRGTVWWIDALSRVARTGVQGLIGALLAAGPLSLVDLTTWQTALLVAGGAVFTAVKAEIARHQTGTLTPASLTRLVQLEQHLTDHHEGTPR